MDHHNRVGDKEQNKEILAMEAKLGRIMQPVEPRPEFAANLKRSLLHQPEATLREPGQGLIQYVVLGTAGVLSGALILVFGIKAVSGLIGSIQQVKKQVEQNPSTSLGSAT
jgi:hypothetical protein